ncbi:serine hydrolase [Anaerolentibacter hominis]|uniref:serine hydrolase n=1 Tax=Anaerolentibacter hominis TaxID=3079009 RepID=UPI0031B85DDE
MELIQITAVAVFAAFYLAYFTKMILQHRKGIKTDQIGKGNKPRKTLIIEILMKFATYAIVPVEAISIIGKFRMGKSSFAWTGIVIAALGVLVFIMAMAAMRDSWRAGIPEKDKTDLVTTGIYRFSRNPAFLGFDLMYLGLLMAFFNYLHLIFVLYAVVMLHLQILQEEKFLSDTFGEPYTEYKKHTGRYFIFDKSCSKKKMMIATLFIVLCIGLGLGGFIIYGKHQLSKLPELTFTEALEYTTKNNRNAVITVGIIKNGEMSYKVYGKDGKELPAQLHTYEIGSLTKTFTAALINKAIDDGKISLDCTIDHYLPLSNDNKYPTIQELLTHSSGYKGYYFEYPMAVNFLLGRNDFYGITKEMAIDKANALSMDREEYDFTYSNYGYAVLGLVLESVYNTDYVNLLNDFAQNELGLTATKISDGNGDLGNYWDWKTSDAYLPAGAVTSNISDMLSYAQMQLDCNPYFAECHKGLKSINASAERNKSMGIHMDGIGMSWIIDSENDIIWHNGGTGDYNSYLGFRPGTGTAVVVLSNLPPNDRIPATVLGIKLLSELEHWQL